jgi:hypothetical protein
MSTFEHIRSTHSLHFLLFLPVLFPTSHSSRDGLRSSSVLGGGDISFSYVYLAHPRTVTGFSWRKTSKYMPRLVGLRILLLGHLHFFPLTFSQGFRCQHDCDLMRGQHLPPVVRDPPSRGRHREHGATRPGRGKRLKVQDAPAEGPLHTEV